MNTTKCDLSAFTAQLERHIQVPVRRSEYEPTSPYAIRYTDSIQTEDFTLRYTLNRRRMEPAYVAILDRTDETLWENFVRRTWLKRCLMAFDLPMIKEARDM